MKLQLLPSTFGPDGAASPRQHLTCFVIDDAIAVDAGSLAMAATPELQAGIRDVVLTHAHLDHIAGLPLFLDDLFATLERPVTVHAPRSVIDTLERDVFNWSVYPRFSELSNSIGQVLEYRPFTPGEEFVVKHLTFRSIEVNHKVPSTGFFISDGKSQIALSGDTAEMDEFWRVVAEAKGLDAILMECAFPNELEDLARVSHHLTPNHLRTELAKCPGTTCRVYVVNLKPMYREVILKQLAELDLPDLQALEVGREYVWPGDGR